MYRGSLGSEAVLFFYKDWSQVGSRMAGEEGSAGSVSGGGSIGFTLFSY